MILGFRRAPAVAAHQEPNMPNLTLLWNFDKRGEQMLNFVTWFKRFHVNCA
jgi:hypothetical protein